MGASERPFRNHLLCSLNQQSLDRLQPALREVEFEVRTTLHPAGMPISTVYFPESGWASMIATLEDGDGAEVGLIGREGVVGLPVVLGADADGLEAMVQCSGTALALSSDALRQAIDQDGALRTILLRYALAHHSQVARTAACNGRHHIDQRLARWLLMAHDRSDGDHFPITHEFLSMMLGVRRAGISLAMAALQKAEFIQYARGSVAVVDRPGLESASCECHDAARKAYDRLLPALDVSGAPISQDGPGD